MCGSIPRSKSLCETVPIRPQPTLTELGLFAGWTIDTILFGNDWRWEPLIVGGKLRLGTVVLRGGTRGDVGALYGLPKGGRGIGDGVVGTFVKGGVGHEGSPHRQWERGIWRTVPRPWIHLEGENRGFLWINAVGTRIGQYWDRTGIKTRSRVPLP